MTGQYPRTHGSYSNFRDVRLSPETPNLYNTLSGLGYAISHVGKCHYAPVPYGATRPDTTLPYEEFRDYYLSLGIDHLRLQDDKQVSVWFRDDYADELDAAGHLEAYRAAVWDKESAKVFTFPGPAEWHPDAWVGRNACEVIAEAPEDNPFFLWTSISGPHFPFDPPAEYLDRVDTEAMGEPFRAGELDDRSRIHYYSLHGAPGRWIESGKNADYSEEYWTRLRTHYYANVALIDDQVGAIMDAAEARFGDNVVIMFTPDHGEMLGNHGMWGKGHCFYQDVLNVPFLVRRPEQVGAGTRSDALVSLIDIYPTLVELAGGETPDVDGISLLADSPGHDLVFAEGEGFQAVTDGHHKLVTVHAHGRRWTELFDLEADPHEVTTVAGDPAYAQVERDLQAAATHALMDASLP